MNKRVSRKKCGLLADIYIYISAFPGATVEELHTRNIVVRNREFLENECS